MGVFGYMDFIQLTIYTLALMGTVIANTLLFLRSRKIRLVSAYFRIQFLIVLWMVGKFFKVLVNATNGLKIWIDIEYFGICYFGVALLYFAYLYYHNRPLQPFLHIGLILLSTMNYIILLTNEQHFLFFKQIAIYNSIKGPFFYVHTGFSYFLIAVSICYMIVSPANKAFKKSDYLIISLSLIIPVAINVIYVFSLLPIFVDLTPITINIVLLNFAFIAFRQNQYDIQMMTKYRIFENLYEAIIILNEKNRVVEYNKKTEEMLEGYTDLHKYMHFEEIFPELMNKVERFLHTDALTEQVEVNTPKLSNEKYYILSMEKIILKQENNRGMIIKFIDMTEHHQLLVELEEKNKYLKEINRTLNANISVNKRLILEQERNYVSKEVHDTLGHSMTLVISLLEACRQVYNKNNTEVKEKLTLAMEITRDSLLNLRKSLTRKRSSNMSNQQLIEELEGLIQEFRMSSIDVEFITNKYETNLKPQCYDAIYRICQESMTNALRHGKATKIMIAVRFSKEVTDIIIVDNGKGCKKLEKGYGILGMEQRVSEMNGTFSCGSPDGEGFHLHVTIPVFS